MKKNINMSLLLISILGILMTAFLSTYMAYRFFLSQVETDLSEDARILDRKSVV